MKRGIQTI